MNAPGRSGPTIDTSHGHSCGNYSELAFVESKGGNRRIAGYATVSATRLQVKISRYNFRSCDRAKYNY